MKAVKRSLTVSKRPSLLIDGQFSVSSAYSVPSHILKPTHVNSAAFAEVKTESEIRQMRVPCRIAASALLLATRIAQVGVTTEEIDKAVSSYIVSRGAYPSGIGFMGFPKSICVSVNEVVAHGIPDNRPLQNGDIVNFDVTCWKDGFYGDCSGMVAVGEVDAEGHRLINTTQEATETAIDKCTEGETLSVVPNTISEIARKAGFSVVPYFAGHFIGRSMHQAPNVSHWHSDESMRNVVLKEGHVFTVEPILCEGDPEANVWQDGWTYVTKDGGRTAQFEHTIVVRKNQPERLTIPDNENFVF